MAITRLWQAGFESNGTGSIAEFSGTGETPDISSAYVKTGTYSLRLESRDYGWVTIPATRQFRISAHMYSAGQYAFTPALISWLSGATSLGSIDAPSGGNMALDIAGTDQDSQGGVFPQSDWAHVGIDIKIDSSAGWVKVYWDGAEILSFSGNTGNADIDSIRFGGGPTAYLQAYTYFDDCYIDDTTGEAAAAAVPDRRFAYLTPNGNGAYSQCAGSDGNSTDNYALVDERPHTTDADYVVADAVDERDTYVMSDIALAAGWEVIAVIPVAYARKTDGGVDTKIALALYEDTTDWTGSEQAPLTAYGCLWERRTTRPGGADWDEASVNALEAGFVGKGTF